MPHLRYLRHRDIGEAGLAEHAPGLGRIAESEEWRTRWNRHIHVPVLLNRPDHDSKGDRLVRRVPNGESNAASGAQYAMRFSQGLLWPAEVQHPEVQDNGI